MRTTRAFLIIFAVVVAVLMTSCGFILPVKQIWTYTSPSGYIRQLVISSDYIQFIDYYSGDLPLADALVPYSFSEDGTISLTYNRGAIFTEEVGIHIVPVDEDSLILTETRGGYTDTYEYTLEEETGNFIDDYHFERSDSYDQVDPFDNLADESCMYLHFNKTFRWVGYTPSHKEVLLASGTFVYDNEDPANLKLYLEISYKYGNLLATKFPKEFEVGIIGTDYALIDDNYIFEY